MSNESHKVQPKAKRDKQDLAAAVAKGKRLVAEAVRADSTKPESKAKPPKAGRGGGSNSYLASAVDPEFSGKGVGVPDPETIPSVKFQTRFTDTLIADSHGNALACHAPCLSNGGYHPMLVYATGSNDPEISALASGGTVVVDAGGDITQGFVHDIVDSLTLTAMQQNFAACRPVSMVAKFVPTEALLSAQGAIYAGIGSREQSPGSLSLPTNGVTIENAGGGLDQSPSSKDINMSNTPLLADLVSGAQYSSNITKPVNLVWRFEDTQDHVYRDLQDTTDADVTTLYDADLGSYNPESCFVQPSLVASSDSSFAWFVPGGISYITGNLPSVANPQIITERPNQNWTYPWTFWALRGCTTDGAAVGQVTFIVNWECIPLTGVKTINSVTPSPSNPMELAQASNILPSLPAAYNPDNKGAPETQLFNAAKQAASHLYDSTPLKSAVEGKSWLTKAGSAAAKVASAVLPFPLSLVATGAEAFLDSI